MNNARRSPPDRRQVLFVAAGAMVGVGVLVSLWPLLDTMNPAADVRARFTPVDLRKIAAGSALLVAWHGVPVLVAKRTPEQLALLRNLPASQRPRAAAPGAPSEQPPGTDNWHRSLRPEIGILIARCTREDCLVARRETSTNVIDHRCPCCQATFDLAGRILYGPAPRDLRVPPHRFISEHELLLGAPG